MGLRVLRSHAFIFELVSEQSPGFPGGASGQEPACQCRRCQRDVGSRTCPGGSDGTESACNVGDLGSTPGSGRSLGGGNGTHSSILAWRIPWTEEPGGLQFLGLHRVGHDCINLAWHGSEVRELGQGRDAGCSLDRTGTGLFWLLLCRFFHPLPHLFSGEDFPEPGLILWFLLCMFSMK